MTRTLVVEKLTPGGDGFGHLPDGRAAFAAGTLPGDVIHIDELREHRGYVRIASWRLATPSTQRRPPPCPVAERCGACSWMALPESAQRQAKASLLAEALERTGRFRNVEGVEVANPPLGPNSGAVQGALVQRAFQAGAVLPPLRFASDDLPSLRYRQRARLHFDESGAMGFFARGSHELVDAAACLVLRPELERAIAGLNAVRQTAALEFAAFADVEVRAFEGQWSLSFTGRTSDAALSSAVLQQLSARFMVSVRPLRREVSLRRGASPGAKRRRWKEQARVAPTTKRMRLPLLDQLSLFAAPSDFTQVHWEVNQAILRELVAGTQERGLETFLDLYAGAGNFSLPLLQSGLSGLAIEENASAIESAKLAAAAQGLDPATFVRQDVGRWLQRQTSRGRSFDLVVTDPPRAGIVHGLNEIAKLASRFVFMCACDPVTFARDLRRFVDLGWAVEAITLYDMFPQTHHFEISAWLRRL